MWEVEKIRCRCRKRTPTRMGYYVHYIPQGNINRDQTEHSIRKDGHAGAKKRISIATYFDDVDQDGKPTRSKIVGASTSGKASFRHDDALQVAPTPSHRSRRLTRVRRPFPTPFGSDLYPTWDDIGIILKLLWKKNRPFKRSESITSSLACLLVMVFLLLLLLLLT